LLEFRFIRGLVLRAVKGQSNDMKLKYFPKDFQEDPEFVLEVCNWYDLPKM
jgi:hypothetical protein